MWKMVREHVLLIRYTWLQCEGWTTKFRSVTKFGTVLPPC